MQSILLIDNYDSFTWNLAQLLRETGLCKVTVLANDQIEVDDCGSYNRIIISPGPGLPFQAGVTCDIIRRWAEEKSILGVCLGHQAIGEVFGAKLIPMDVVLHGEMQEVVVCDPADRLFGNLPQKFDAGRYHSWTLDAGSFPSCLRITALDTLGRVMALSHTRFDVKGVQFHPESVMTPHGRQLIENWLVS